MSAKRSFKSTDKLEKQGKSKKPRTEERSPSLGGTGILRNIEIVGAYQHNLKGVNLEIPKGKLTLFSGISGSGKSSLVFDTICAEAQRQLIETFSAHARQRLPKIGRPDVEEIRNLSPVIVIDQKKMGTTSRSTVGTATEIYTLLRVLFSRFGVPRVPHSGFLSFNNPEGMCLACNGIGKEIVIDEDLLLNKKLSIEEGAVQHSYFKKGSWYWRQLMVCGFFDPRKPIDQFTKEEFHMLLYTEETKFMGDDIREGHESKYEGVITRLKKRYSERAIGENANADIFVSRQCRRCKGSRINDLARSVEFSGKTLPDLVFMEFHELISCFSDIRGPEKVQSILQTILKSLNVLVNVGVGYLSLHRQVATLSGGESQRVKMARQLDVGLVNLIYVLDEPTVGLHPSDIGSLIDLMNDLRDRENTLLVVEHDPSVIANADNIVDIGPGAGSAGGHIVFQGTYRELMKSNTITARYLLKGYSASRNHANARKRRPWNEFYEISNATRHNLDNLSVRIPKGVFVCVTGVAGSGKSTLIGEIFVEKHTEAILVDQSSVGRTSRSNALTYMGIFTQVRKELAEATGASAAMFSFNSKGACPKCNGSGILKFEMSFLDAMTVPCDTCNGKRYTSEILNLEYKGKNISEILRLTVTDAIPFFKSKEVKRKLRVLERVGLDYLEIGQSLSTLSGGEAQRIKLASELHKRGNLYVMDEPTTGMHMADIAKLQTIIDSLVDAGNSVIVIEHNLDVVVNADWIIDLGPGGGTAGGRIVAYGVPEDVVLVEGSLTGKYLRDYL